MGCRSQLTGMGIMFVWGNQRGAVGSWIGAKKSTLQLAQLQSSGTAGS